MAWDNLCGKGLVYMYIYTIEETHNVALREESLEKGKKFREFLLEYL